uniref:ErfK/YbiS/YcfS/YnhG family protein n=1 Tax=uncultured bacterium W5-47b TaxID=1130998 RepID=H9BX49_9BACT|nr:ErfK/YbiS/YcfS/YnhG family protein [uncultured bacterium W5-47b]
MPGKSASNLLRKLFSLLKQYIDKNTVRNVIYISLTIILFMAGVIVYGVILNIREVSISKALLEKGFTRLQNPNIIIDRDTYALNLYEDTVLVKSYRVSFGRNIHKIKNKAGDEATPVGEYKICSIDTSHQYHIFFRLNYPNLNDAAEALRKGWITQKEFNQIKFEFYYEGCTKYNEALGGDIGIHGIGRLNYIFKNLPFVFNWTNGSIAMSDENMNELYSIVKVGTKVVVK